MLPYNGDTETHCLRSTEKYVTKLLPKKSTLQTAYSGKKLSTQFNIKEETYFKHQYELIYHEKCPIPACKDNYIGKTAHHKNERIKDHNGRDHKPHMLKHSIEKHHDNVTQENFKIMLRTQWRNWIKTWQGAF